MYLFGSHKQKMHRTYVLIPFLYKPTSILLAQSKTIITLAEINVYIILFEYFCIKLL